MDATKAFPEPKGVPTFPLIESLFEILGILAYCRMAMERQESYLTPAIACAML